MKTIWSRLEAWFAANTPGGLALRPGASEAELVAFETAIGRRLPDDLRESYAIHDGQDMPSVRWFDGERRLHPLKSILVQWRYDADHSEAGIPEELTDHERARLCMKHRDRLPLIGVDYWDGDNLYADFVPGPAGRAGQLLYRQDIDLVVVAEGWRAFLEEYLRRLEAGALEYREGVAMYPEAMGQIVVRGANVTYGHDVLAGLALR